MIDFTDAGLDTYLDDDPGGPVVMLNLLRFKPDGGAQLYQRYAASFAETGVTADYGLEIVYAGAGSTTLVGENGQDWDMVALIRYPSREKFVGMIRDPRYQRFEHLRRDALQESVLQATAPVPV